MKGKFDPPHHFYGRKSGAGFTIIELVVTIAIIGALIAIVAMSLTYSQMRSRDAVRISDIEALHSAVEMYIEDHDSPPPLISWQSFISEIDEYLDGNVPQGIAFDYPYGYCRDVNGDTNKYIVGALLETKTDIAGDLDGPQGGYDCAECVFNNDVCQNPPNCDDMEGGYFRNNNGTVFCLGHDNPQGH